MTRFLTFSSPHSPFQYRRESQESETRKKLRRLQIALKCEFVSIKIFVVLAVLSNIIWAVGAAGDWLPEWTLVFCAVVLGTADLAFSYYATRLFLVPILRVVQDKNADVRKGEHFKIIQATMRMALVGGALSLGTSTVLYLNWMLYFTLRGPFRSSVWLNLFTFGITVDSISNEWGLFLASGVFVHFSPLATAKGWFTHGPHRPQRGDMALSNTHSTFARDVTTELFHPEDLESGTGSSSGPYSSM
jgi:hypothetical protein